MTGKTVDEALRKAKEELGVTDEDTGFEILEMPRSSFFGLKKTPAKVRVYLIEEEPPKKPAAPEKPREPRKAPAEKPVSQERPAPAERAGRGGTPGAAGRPVKPERPEKLEKAPKAGALPKEQKAPAAEQKAPPKPREPKPEGPVKPEPQGRRPQQKPAREQAAPSPESFTPQEELSEKAKAAIRYVSDILEAMGVQGATVRARQTPESIELYLEGSGLGVIIGRRGETLDAVQYLTSLVANRVDGDYVRISIDSGDYRQKRTETLEHLAQKLARNAVKTGRSTRLEPMNPYERRIIHAAVSKVEGATSSSIGEEPNRRVIISAKGARKKQEGEGRRDAPRPGGAPRGRGRDGARDGRRYDRPRPAAPEAAAEKAERIHDGDIEIPQDLAPKPLAAPQPVSKAAAAPHTPTAEEKDALPLYGKMDL